MRFAWVWWVMGAVWCVMGALGCAGSAVEKSELESGDAPLGDTDTGQTGPARPELPEGAYLRIAAAQGGAEVLVGEDGLLRADVLVGDVANLRTLGFGLHVDGARLVEWRRDDTLLTSNGGEVLQLVGYSNGELLEMVVATTKAVSVPREGGRVASLTLVPTSPLGALRFDVAGDDHGVIAADGAPITVTAMDVTFAAN
ncbi:MAG: hypothetical protein A2289_19050 [Deltaproteobacteria bacterium RIFOXYA12_FULL_58_15]|nr:MAG: hypothetical protein A2289_19050 [Deltaproteobacteria bacterium RIFOXYA12_FULL_58_15]OGR08509.1 MAG: hypothetical protein A2341_03005 [Deltaproteobacteria bacterium RIFOXYB12_FULL_58_9]